MRSLVARVGVVLPLLLACGGRTPLDEDEAFDAGAVDAIVRDTALDTHVDDTSTLEVVAKDTAPIATTGDDCKYDSDCDKDRTGTHICSENLDPTLGTLDPLPICLEIGCTPGTPSAPAPCDGGRGFCLRYEGKGVCQPACTFGSDGSPPVGCPTPEDGADACNVYALTSPSTGVGFCFGGCEPAVPRACMGAPSHCQTETALCVNEVFIFTKKLGDSCTDADTTAHACYCLAPSATAPGFCSNFCRTGTGTGTGCSDGFSCTAMIDASFGETPSGVAGRCAKTCASDAECAPMNATCQATTDGRVCLPVGVVFHAP